MDSELIGCIVVFLIVAAAFLLWGAISPEGMWRSTQSWQFKNPEANEPSESAYAVTRITSIISILVLLCTACFIMDLGGIASGKTEEDKQYEECLEEHEDDWRSDYGDDEPWDDSSDDPLSRDHPLSTDDPLSTHDHDWDIEDEDSAADECAHLSPEPR